jgi:2-polyprenyl-6-methoxyphenol hydroxylase-like FAD-dependent oxidoreductase
MNKVIIVGGGMAGLTSAKVLANHFTEVILIEGHEPTQGHHLHVLLKSGQLSLERIFPGISAKYHASNCPFIDWAQDTVWENNNGQFPQYDSAVRTFSMGRRFLHQLMLKELELVKNVTFIKDLALDFVFDEKARVTTATGERIEADYLVLAAGENFPFQRVAKLLKQKKREINLTYRSLIFKTQDLNMEGFKQYYYQLDPPLSHLGGVISPIEDGKTMVTLIEAEAILSVCKTHGDFFEKAKNVPGGKFYQIITNAIPMTEVTTFRKPTMTKRTFDLKTLPSQLILLGDLHTSLNPIFGQGMGLTLLQVELLDKKMKGKFSNLKFHQEIQKLIRYPFFLSMVGSLESGVLKKGLRLFLKLCQKSPMLHQQFLIHLHSLGKKRRLT